jgi:aminoglycoside phosphotransferase (APT) family kinase protein
VRVGEELDRAALESYLRRELSQLFDGTDEVTNSIEITQFPGGHSNLTYLVRFGPHEFVLRRPPVGPVAPTAHNMPREFRLLAAIHPLFNLAPKAVVLCEDATVIGVPFYLMERRHGLIVRDRIPREIGDDLTLRRRLSESVVDTLVALQAVDIYSSGMVQIGKPAGFVARQVRGWADRWERAKTGELPEMEQVIAWLTERLPVESESSATIVHNDFKLDNVMLDPEDPARVVAVLDWEMCTVGDPLIDLGLFLCYWTMQHGEENQHRSLRAVTTGAGWLTREEIIERYATQTRRDLSAIVWYETFARFKVAVVIQQIYFRFVRGQTNDERFRDLDQLVRELARAALAFAK